MDAAKLIFMRWIPMMLLYPTFTYGSMCGFKRKCLFMEWYASESGTNPCFDHWYYIIWLYQMCHNEMGDANCPFLLTLLWSCIPYLWLSLCSCNFRVLAYADVIVTRLLKFHFTTMLLLSWSVAAQLVCVERHICNGVNKTKDKNATEWAFSIFW